MTCSRQVLAVALFVAMAVASGCSRSPAETVTTTAPVISADREPRRPTRATVVVLGDSISRLSDPAIAAELADGYEVVTRSRDGTTIAEQLSWAALHAPGGDGRQADAMLIELGINDVLFRNRDVIADLGRLARAVRDVPCVVWYSLIQYPTEVGLVAARVNAELRRLPSVDQRFFFTDLNEPFYGRSGAVGPDGVHPTLLGRRYLAEAYARDLVKTCDLPPVPG